MITIRLAGVNVGIESNYDLSPRVAGWITDAAPDFTVTVDPHELKKEDRGRGLAPDYLDFICACYSSDGDYAFIGTPSVDASGPRFRALETISVAASTDQSEGCKKFLNFLFSGAGISSGSTELSDIITNKEIMEDI